MQTVFCLTRGLCDTMHHTYTTIELHDDGLYSVGGEVALHELTADERAEYDACVASEPPSDPAWEQPPLKFSTIDDAIEYGEAGQRMSDTDADLAMFNAPSECWGDAMPRLEKAMYAAMAKAVQ